VGQYTVSVNVYNSAGEVVKTIFVKQFIQPVNSISLPSNIISTLTGPGSTIQIYYQGVLIGTWDGSNNSGNPVSNGTYQIQVDNTGVSGVVTSVSQQVMVNRQLSNVTASIFNSAGEVVRNLYQVVADSTSSEMTNVSLSTNTFQPGIPVTSSQLNSVQILVMTSSSTAVTLSWNGTNDTGSVVTPGRYEIEVHWDNGQGGELNITRAILVLAGTGSGGMVVARPNVLAKGITETTFDGSSVPNAMSLKVNLYTISGQLVTVVGPSGTATALWSATGVASGIYIASVEVMDGNGSVIHQQRLKLLVIH
jgi:flagellar hook assembly protein FlgD